MLPIVFYRWYDMNILVICIFFTIVALVLRCWIAASIYTFFSKRERAEYRAKTNLLQRWFLFCTARFVKDKYSKTEKRVICYSDIVRFYCAVHTIVQIALIVEYSICLLCTFGRLEDNVLNVMSIAYAVLCLLAFTSFAVIESCTNRNYHRSRMKRRK